MMRKFIPWIIGVVTLLVVCVLAVCLYKKCVTPTGIVITNAPRLMKMDDVENLEYNIFPESAKGAVTWKSSNDKVIAVDENGVITAVRDGVATISVFTENGISTSVDIEVFTIDGEWHASKTFDQTMGNALTPEQNKTVAATRFLCSGNRGMLLVDNNRCLFEGVLSKTDNGGDGEHADYKIQYNPNFAAEITVLSRDEITVKDGTLVIYLDRK